MTKDKLDIDKEIFTISRKSFPIAHIPGIGKFCKNGCGKRIDNIIVKNNKYKVNPVFKRKPTTKLFCSIYCKQTYYRKQNLYTADKSLACRITLNVYQDKFPYRLISIYLKKGIKKEIKIRENNELWYFLEYLSNQRKPSKQVIKGINQ